MTILNNNVNARFGKFITNIMFSGGVIVEKDTPPIVIMYLLAVVVTVKLVNHGASLTIALPPPALQLGILLEG